MIALYFLDKFTNSWCIVIDLSLVSRQFVWSWNNSVFFFFFAIYLLKMRFCPLCYQFFKFEFMCLIISGSGWILRCHFWKELPQGGKFHISVTASLFSLESCRYSRSDCFNVTMRRLFCNTWSSNEKNDSRHYVVLDGTMRNLSTLDLPFSCLFRLLYGKGIHLHVYINISFQTSIIFTQQ